MSSQSFKWMLRFPARCATCGGAMSKGMWAWRDPTLGRGHQFWHESCTPPPGAKPLSDPSQPPPAMPPETREEEANAGLPEMTPGEAVEMMRESLNQLPPSPSVFGQMFPTAAKPPPSAAQEPKPPPAGSESELIRILREVTKGNLDPAQIKALIQKAVDEAVAAKVAPKPRTINVKIERPNGETVKVEGAHKHFPYLIALMGAHMPVWLVGPKGTGKSRVVSDASKHLGVPHDRFFPISVGPQSIASDFLGFKYPDGTTYRPAYREWFQHGGTLCLDEADAASPDVLVVLNASLSNGWCMFPDGLCERHPEAVIVACANTDGSGRTEQYAGRQTQDAAVLDRFFFLDWPLDEAIEDSLCPDKDWLSYVRRARAALSNTGAEVSMRASIMGSAALSLGIPHAMVVRGTINKGLSPEAADVLLAVPKTDPGTEKSSAKRK